MYFSDAVMRPDLFGRSIVEIKLNVSISKT